MRQTTRLLPMAFVVLSVASGPASLPAADTPRRPNVLLVMTDDK